MKKLILLILAFVSVVVTAGCNFELPFDLPFDLPWEDGEVETPEVQLSKELKDGVSFLKQLYEKASVETGADFVRVGKAAKCTVTWTVTVISGNVEDVKIVANEDGTYTIDVNEKAESDVEYILTATITYGEESTTLTFNHKLPKFKELTYAEYAQKAAGDAVVVKGIIVGILSKDLGDTVDGLYLHTPEGGFYVYGVANVAEVPMSTYKLGQEVRASGTMDIYSGTLEVKDATIEILNETPVAYEAVDLTEAFKAAADLKDATIVGKQAMLVTLKGVTLTTIDESNGYYKFKLGSLESYVRISGSTCPLNAADSATFKSEFASHLGWLANVTGVVSVYSGAFYLQPCTLDAVEYVSLPELTDAEKVTFEKDLLSIDTTKLYDGAVYQLPVAGTTYSDVAISWTSNSEYAVVGADGKVTVSTNNQAVEFVLTATLSYNGNTATKEIAVKIEKQPDAINTTVAALVAEVPTTSKDKVYVVTATWTAKDGMLPANNTYGNGFLSEGDAKVTIYGLSADASCLTYSNGAYTYKNAKNFPSLEINDGAVIKVGMIYDAQYSNYSAYLIEIISNGTVVEPSNEPAPVETTISELAANKPTADGAVIYIVTGTWSAKDGMAVASNTYGNGFLSEGDAQITIYGLSADASCLTYGSAYAYKNAKNFPTLGIEDGAVIKVGMIYTCQYDNYSAYLIEIVSNSGSGEQPTHEHNLCPECGKCLKADCPEDKCAGHASQGGQISIAEAITIGAAQDSNTYTTEKYTLTGTITSVENATYGNVMITDGTNSILIYGLYTADGSTRYDAMSYKPVKGDVITVTGSLGRYYDTKQMKNGWLVELVAHTCSDTAATCTAPSKCTICDVIKAEALGHNFVDGACATCGAADPSLGGVVETITASKTIAACITEYGWTNTTTKQEFNLDENVTVKINGGSNTGKAYNGDHIRVYATDSPAGTITITVPEGYELVSVKVTAQTGTYAFLCVDGAGDDICNETVSISGNSVVLKSVKNGSDGKQVRVTAIEVVYQAK